MQEIPYLHPETGISKDYIKTFGPLNLYLRAQYDGKQTDRIRVFSAQNLKTHTFLKYGEWFPLDQFTDAITEKNKPLVAKLDDIVIELNQRVKEGTIADVPADLSGNPRSVVLFNEVARIILNKNDFDFRPICRTQDLNTYFWS